MMLRRSFLGSALAGLGTIATGHAWASEATAYPVTIRHALGTTVIPRKPERIAAVNWANHEVPLALGVVPVGFARANFGDEGGSGLLPWVAARLKELGAGTPVLFDEGDGIDFEAVAATRPDVILAAHSGLSQADYETLGQIAPVIAYPEGPWSTSWRDTIRLNSAGMGMAQDGEALIARLETQIAQAVAGHPVLHDKSAMFITHLNARDLSRINFYSTQDTRVRFFSDLGLRSPKGVIEASRLAQFSGSVSAERIDLFDDVDIFVTYGGPELLAALTADPLASKLPAIARGSIVVLGNNPVGTAASPTPLGLPWILKDYVALLADAAGKSR